MKRYDNLCKILAYYSWGGSMIKRILFLMIFVLVTSSTFVQAEEEKVEVFHINKGKVVKEVPMNETMQQSVETILNGVTDVFRGFEPIPQNGYMVKIPLDPAFNPKNDWIKEAVNEVIIIFPEYENPHILVFNSENNPGFYSFNASVDRLLKEIDLKFKGQRE